MFTHLPTFWASNLPHELIYATEQAGITGQYIQVLEYSDASCNNLAMGLVVALGKRTT